jgi:hypothetical protein
VRLTVSPPSVRRLFRKCGNFCASQQNGHSQSVTEIHILFHLFHIIISVMCLLIIKTFLEIIHGLSLILGFRDLPDSVPDLQTIIIWSQTRA